MEVLYQLGLALALAVVGPILLVRRGRHYLTTLRGRLGLALPAGPRGALWIHAVSVGEVGVAEALARALPPSQPLLITTITPTGQERARRTFAARGGVGYLPFDLGPPIQRFLDRLAPAALVLVEGDYWPLLLARCGRRGLPVTVINGRVGDTTARRLARWPRVAGWLLGGVGRFGVQSAEDQQRLLALGVPPERVTVTGNLKYEAPEPTPQPDLERRLAALAGGRPLLLAGSTMPGEEDAVLAAFAALHGHEAMLVLAPRHPERFDEVARRLAARGIPTVRRSALAADAPAADARPAVVLLDSLGELAALYRIATACFVGGTLAHTGGHNPLEPARYGLPIAVGPSMENFRDMAAQFDAAGAWQRVRDAASLGSTWRGWLEDAGEARAMGERGRRLVEANRGALASTLEVLAPVIAALRPAGAAAPRSPGTAAAAVAR